MQMYKHWLISISLLNAVQIRSKRFVQRLRLLNKNLIRSHKDILDFMRYCSEVKDFGETLVRLALAVRTPKPE